VDVAFLLLIFFMSTTQFKPPEPVAVDLPTSQSEIHVPETGVILLTVNRTGQIFISSETGRDVQALAPQDVLDAVVAWRSRNPDAVVVVKGDRGAAFGTMADLMNALAEAKTLRFNLMTDLAKQTRGEREQGRSAPERQPAEQPTEQPAEQPTERPEQG
jgi:biopolymer transport protein ExbD